MLEHAPAWLHRHVLVAAALVVCLSMTQCNLKQKSMYAYRFEQAISKGSPFTLSMVRKVSVSEWWVADHPLAVVGEDVPFYFHQVLRVDVNAGEYLTKDMFIAK